MPAMRCCPTIDLDGSRAQCKAGVDCVPLTGVATLMLDILSQLQSGGREEAEGAGATSLLLVGPPGVGQQRNL